MKDRFPTLQNTLSDPEMQERARAAAIQLGGAALKGAVEGAGVGTVGPDGRIVVSKRGVVKTVLMPRRAARKAVMGATGNVVATGKGMATEAARGAVLSAFERARSGDPNDWGEASAARTPDTDWDKPSSADTSWDAPTSSYNSYGARATSRTVAPSKAPGSDWGEAPGARELPPTEGWD